MQDPIEEARARAMEVLDSETIGRFWLAVTNDVDRLRGEEAGRRAVALYETKILLAARETYAALQDSLRSRPAYRRPRSVDKETLPHVGPYHVCLVWNPP